MYESVEVIAIEIKTSKAIAKKIMSFAEWKNITKKPGYNYYAFQIGYSQFN